MANSLVLQTDFGLVDGAVSAMYGVAYSVDPKLSVSDLTHDIPPYDIWNASYRLLQTVPYWPAGTVFVSVVDPGVGSDRRSIVCQTSGGHYLITPDNGSITHLARKLGIVAVRQIDETKSRLQHSEESHTFHGRDIYAYNGARLASGEIKFEQLGKEVALDSCVFLPTVNASFDGTYLKGTIDILDVRFGSLWTNINIDLVRQAGINRGDMLEVTIFRSNTAVYVSRMLFGRSFADVALGETLVYVNSLTNLGVAINQDSFAKVFHIGTGVDWTIQLRKVGEAEFETQRPA